MDSQLLSKLLLKEKPDLTFNQLESGFYLEDMPQGHFPSITEHFPNSMFTGVHTDDHICGKLNKSAKKGHQYFCEVLARDNANSNFYETKHPHSSSLYEPDTEFIQNFTALSAMKAQIVTERTTKTIDEFVNDLNLGPVDFLRLSSQGAELDILESGRETTKQAAAVVCSAQFIPIYLNQPLFGDLCAHMFKQGFMFHSMFGIGGRTIQPTTMGNDLHYVSQQMWANVIFLPSIKDMDSISETRLLKSAFLAHEMGLMDVAYHLMHAYDLRRDNFELSSEFRRLQSTKS